jgi:fatty acid desaturase
MPVAIGSVVLMAHIVTNHSLSPMTQVNDPLANSLSVTVPRWLSIYTLQFGLHVEHHMFPAMSGRHAPFVRELIRERWGDRYRSMSLLKALRRMFITGRVYKDAKTLYDPLTGSEAPTI